MKTKTIAYSGVYAALYFVLTTVIAPLSYGPFQFRMSNLLKPIALFDPAFALAIGLGTAFANLFSPFGFWDWLIMPCVDLLAAVTCYQLRHWPYLALTIQSVVVSVGVCLFPLGQGAHLPFAATFLPVLIPNLLVPLLGYIFVWKREDIHALIAAGERQANQAPSI